MQIKLDENIPAELSMLLSAQGHDVDTVADESLTGSADATIWAATCAAERFFVTQDLDFSDLRRFIPGSHPGLLLLRLHHPSRRRLITVLRQLFASEDVPSWSGCVVVATDSKLRIRRPPG